MNPEIAEMLCGYLPPEIVAEIDSHLIAAYRRKVAQALSKMIRTDVEMSRNDEIVVRGVEFIYNRDFCPRCGNAISSLTYHLKFESEYSNNNFTFEKCATRPDAMRCQCY